VKHEKEKNKKGVIPAQATNNLSNLENASCRSPHSLQFKNASPRRPRVLSSAARDLAWNSTEPYAPSPLRFDIDAHTARSFAHVRNS
jgi:hypothetical protein